MRIANFEYIYRPCNLLFISLQHFLLKGELLRFLRMYGSTSSSSGASRRSRRSPDSPGLRHVLYFSTNGEAYQVFDCNVETHEDWVQTSRNVDIIYPSGPEGELRIMYELATYENYLGVETATVCYIHNQMRVMSGWRSVAVYRVRNLFSPNGAKIAANQQGLPPPELCDLSSQFQGGVWWWCRPCHPQTQ